MLVAWVAFPLALAVLAFGCGLVVDALTGRRVAGVLLPAAGLGLIIVLAGFLTLADATAELATPAIVAVAIAGLAIGARRGRPSAWGWPLAAALATFAAYAAPIVLSGEATFAGYIRLDDTATWMALTDRVMEHGRDLDGLAPSTYEAALAFNLGDGYPIGALLPLGIGSELVGEDVAWLIQPYMAWLGAMLALALWTLAAPVIASRAVRFVVAVVGAQAALLYGYYLWGGVKELAAATLVAAAAAFVPSARLDARTVTDNCRGPKEIRHSSARRWLPIVLVGAATVWALSAGGAVWLLGPLIALYAGTAATAGRKRALLAAGAVVTAVAALSLPVLVAGGLLPPTSAPLTSDDARGNLISPLDPAQIAGIWPAGDFRLEPAAEGLTFVLVALALAAAVGGIAVAAHRRAWPMVAYVGGAVGAAAVIYVLGSPWVDAKALAIASPAVLLAAGIGAGGLLVRGRRVAGAALLASLAAGVLWSNLLAYRDVNLAPRDQLVELQRIGPMIAGEGPTLLTEYQPYGARHLLHEADPEAASELRRRRVQLARGGTLEKGESADTDRFAPAALAVYRTLVLRRSPAQSHPPAEYRRVWAGRFYEVWQRGQRVGGSGDRLPLGTGANPTARPRCARVRALARNAGVDALAGATRPAPIVIETRRLDLPTGWTSLGPRRLLPGDAGTIATTVRTPAPGRYSVWLGGSVRSQAELRIDAKPAGEVLHLLNNEGQYVELGSAPLDRGRHRVEVSLAAAGVHPGSGGAQGAIGPLVLSRAGPAESRIVRVPAERAESLCGRAWDWIEVVGPSR